MPPGGVSLSWHPHPDVWLLVAALAGGYLWVVSRLGPRHVPAGEEPASRRQVTLFMLGVAAIWVAADWPVHDVAERSMYSVHMVQHMLLSLVVPPLLLMGTPAWLLRAILGRGLLLRVARRVCRPLLALLIFNGFLVVTHWPAVVDLSVRSEAVHFLVHAGVFLSALIMWSPVLNPLIELPHLSYPGRMLYLFLQSIVPTVPASFLTFATAPVYRVYETLPKLWGISALDDQRIAGLLMKIGGGLLLWSVIAVLFFQWFAREEADGVDELEWGRVERELNRARLPRP
jgi:putative membrane protein